MPPHVLLVEDDPTVREAVSALLTRAGMAVTVAADGHAGLARFAEDQVDLVLLDLMLPQLDGLEVCREIRSTSATPVVILSARDGVGDLVAGLELGADDYVTKPFEGPELVARIRAVLRRCGGQEDDEAGAPLRFGDLEIDPSGFTATKGGEPLHFTATEFRLLVELAQHAGQVLTREVLLQRVWHYDYLGESRLVDMAVKRVRDKIDQAAGPRYITTVRGVGYRFEREP